MREPPSPSPAVETRIFSLYGPGNFGKVTLLLPSVRPRVSLGKAQEMAPDPEGDDTVTFHNMQFRKNACLFLSIRNPL